MAEELKPRTLAAIIRKAIAEYPGVANPTAALQFGDGQPDLADFIASRVAPPSPEMREALEPGDLEWLAQVLAVEHQHWPGTLQPLTEWQESENARIDRILSLLQQGPRP